MSAPLTAAVMLDRDHNLRRVGPDLYVGDVGAFEVEGPWRSPRGRWITVAQVDEVPSGLHGRREAFARQLGNRALALYIPDSCPIRNEVFDLILRRYTEGGFAPTLVSCIAGLSRSASVAYALLRRAHGQTHEEALACVETRTTGLTYPLLSSSTFTSARAWAEGAR